MSRLMIENTPAQIDKGMVYDRVRKEYARLRAEATGGWVLNENGVEVWACPFIDLFNGLMSPAWPEESVEDLWRQALRLYRQTGQGMFVSLGPSSRPPQLRERIQQDGFRRCAPVPYMHLDLSELKTHPCPDGVRVDRIRDFGFFERQEHPWLGPVGAPYRTRKLQFMREYGEGEGTRLWQFLAFHQRKVVGAVTTFAHRDEVAVFDMVVVRSHRRRGIGTRLMAVACEHARDLGMRAVGLSTSGRGVHLYRKIGFADAGQYHDFFLSRENLVEIRL